MADIQAKVWMGYAKAAAHLGQTYDQYRPNGPSNPTGAANWYGSIVAAFDDNSNFKFSKPNLYGHPDKYALVDGSMVLPGDYLIGNGETVFVADVPHLLPITCMQCNVTIDILRPASNHGVGAQPYGGDEVSTEVPVMTQWPAWIDAGTKGEKSDSGLVGDTRNPWYRVLLPVSPGIILESFDVINDSLGRRMKVSSVELSSLGWRLTAMFAGT